MLKLKQANNPLSTLHCLLQGAKLVNHPQLRRYLWVPLIINIVLYSGAFLLGYYWVSTLIAQFIPDWLSWLTWVLWPLFFVSFLIIGFFSFTLLANLIAAPYYSQLSAKALQVASGQDCPIVEQTWSSVFLGELKRIRYLLLRILPLLLLSLIPVLNLIAPLLWALFAAWGFAMEYMAYPLENRGLNFPQQQQFLKQNRMAMLSFGGGIGLALTLPIINLFAGQSAVIAATLYVRQFGQESGDPV